MWIIIFNVSCIGQQYSMNRLSNDIYNTQKSVFGYDMFLKGLSFDVERSNWYKELEYSTKNDTVFLLEHPGIQGDYYFSFWNKKDTLSYSNVTGHLEFTHKKFVFTKYMTKLVSEWDILGIREEERICSNLSSDMVYATRIVIKNGKYKIDCINFKDFLDFKRDGMNFSD
jgi:hypothetical protein